MTTSIREERRGLPEAGRAVWVEARKVAGDLSSSAQLALVRCEAGRTYGRDRSVFEELRRHGLVQAAAWRVTSLGRCVVEVLVR